MEENLLKPNNIKLVNQSHNNIRRQITNVMNAYNEIPKKIIIILRYKLYHIKSEMLSV